MSVAEDIVHVIYHPLNFLSQLCTIHIKHFKGKTKDF